MSAPLRSLLTWAVIQLLSSSTWRLLGGLVAGVEGTLQLGWPTCTTTDVPGLCESSDTGCPAQVDKNSAECFLPNFTDLRDGRETCGGTNLSPDTFCDGMEPELSDTDLPVSITFSVHQHQQYNVTASWQHLNEWSFQMALSTEDNRAWTGTRYKCGSMSQLASVSLTGNYNDGGEYKNVHNYNDLRELDKNLICPEFCLRNNSGVVRYLRRTFYIGSSCVGFAHHHRIPAHNCRMALSDIGGVNFLTVKASGPSALRVKWTTPWLLARSQGIYTIVYYVTVTRGHTHMSNSSLENYNFTVSNSTNITVNSLHPGCNYTVTVTTWVMCEGCSIAESAVVTMPTSSNAPPTFTSTTGEVDATTTNELTTPITTPTFTSTTGEVAATTTFTTTEGFTGIAGLTVIIGGAVLALVILSLFCAFIVYCFKKRWIKKPKTFSTVRRPTSCPLPPIIGISNSISIESQTNSTPHLETISRISLQFDCEKLSQTDVEAEPSFHDDHPTTDFISIPSHALVVGSLKISTVRHMELIAPLFQHVSDQQVIINMYNVSHESAKYKPYPRQSPSQWVDKALGTSDFVLCICSREFAEDWKAESYEASLVRRVKHHVLGLLNHGEIEKVSHKFVAVVFHREDLQYIPQSLKDCNYFVLDCETNFENLARFLMAIPAVQLQRTSSVEKFQNV